MPTVLKTVDRRLAQLVGVAVLPAVVAGLMVGCSSGGGQVASLGEATLPASTAPNQADAAQRTAKCLGDSGLAAEVFTYDEPEALHIRPVGEHSYLLSYPNGRQDEDMLPGDELADDAALAKFYEAAAQSPRLVVDGVDHSAIWQECLSGAGFRGPESIESDPAVELARRQHQAAVVNRWVACAREHGMPGLADAAPGGQEDPFPSVSLPAGTAPAVLEQVLDACPLDTPADEPGILVDVAEPATQDEEANAAALQAMIDTHMAGPQTITETTR